MRQKLALLEVSLEEYNRLREVAGFEPYFFDNPESGFQLLTRVEFPNLAGLLGEVVSVPMRLGLLGAHDRPIGEAAYRTKSDRERYFKELIAKEDLLSIVSAHFCGSHGLSHTPRKDYFHFGKNSAGVWVLNNLEIARKNLRRYSLKFIPRQEFGMYDRVRAVYCDGETV